MKKLIPALLVLLLAGLANQGFCANTPPPGANTDIIYNNNGQYGPYKLGSGLNVTTSGSSKFLNATTTSALAAGTTGSPQINNGDGTLFGASIVTQPNPQSINQAIWNGNPQLPAMAINALSSRVTYDPRAYGSKCTGWYGMVNFPTSIVGAAGTGFQIGDTFIAGDLQNEGHMRGARNATGHVTSINGSGGVTGFNIDDPGSGYFASGMWANPTSGVGLGFSINPQVYSGPAIPTTTLASGGNATSAGLGGNYNGGSAYVVGDLFGLVNPAQDGNYAVGLVNTTSAGKVATYTLLSSGGDYVSASGVSTIAITGQGIGLTLNVTTTTSAGNTWDDTYGMEVGSNLSANFGGAEVLPDGCWVGTYAPVGGSTTMGNDWAVNYGYNDTLPLHWSAATHVFIEKTPQYGVMLPNTMGGVALVGFEVRGYTGSNFGSSTTWDSTACIGTTLGSGNISPNYTVNMSGKQCYVGLGTYNGGNGGFIFMDDINSDWGANNLGGIIGPFSDFVTINARLVSENNGIWMTSGGGGLTRIYGPRAEYLAYGIRIDSQGQVQISNLQTDRTSYCAIYVNGANQVQVGNSILKGAGLAGTLSVTGAASGTAGVIRLTVTGFGISPTGGSSATSGLVTGDVANVSGVAGTTEANANQWTVTVVDGSHIELQGSTFSNAYVSGGKVSVNGKGSYLCLNDATQFSAVNNFYAGYSAGSNIAAANVIDSTGSSNIYMSGGASFLGNTGFEVSGYQQSFANWHNSGNTPPSDVILDVPGTAAYRNDNIQTGVAFALTNTITNTAATVGTGFYQNKANGLSFSTSGTEIFSATQNVIAWKGALSSVTSGSGDCGTSPVIAGDDTTGRITVGSSTNGGKCTLVFATTKTTAPICVCDNETTASHGCSALNTSTTSSALAAVTTEAAGETIGYHCFGYQQ